MAQMGFLGAKASNAGDSFHELWALRAALELLNPKTELTALTVEGVRAIDSVTAARDPWSGVDCGLYYGGDRFDSADRVELIQLKYSSATPDRNWTIAGLTASDSKGGNNSVIRRLADQFIAAYMKRRGDSSKQTVARFVTNRPVAAQVAAALRDLQQPLSRPAKTSPIPKERKANIEKLRKASGLNKADFVAFCAALSIEGGADSRFALKEHLLLAIGAWTNTNSRTQLDDLLQFVREHMLPESRRDLISRESIFARFGVSDKKSVFPCPSDIKLIAHPVPRSQVQEVLDLINSGKRRICLHGEGGSGKTTLLQELRSKLPQSSTAIIFDCYGGGTYLDSDAYRHRDRDAFTQLINEMASRLQAPLFLLPSHDTPYPTRFMERLVEAAQLQQILDPQSLLVIAIDAADNSISAARECQPPEQSFVRAFARLGAIPANVAFILTARTGRLDLLDLPSSFTLLSVSDFSKEETAAHIASYWSGITTPWIEEFHELSSHNPRVQYYALDASKRSGRLNDALQYLLPGGKGLNQVFSQQIEAAIAKSGSNIDIKKFCAAVVVLARPIPLSILATVTGLTDALIADICNDLAPGIKRSSSGEISLSDEDFERFLDEESRNQGNAIRSDLATYLWSARGVNPYAATHVATALVRAARGTDLVTLLQTEKEPLIISDPVLRREVQLQRLKLGITICHELKAPVDAVKTLLIGTEAITTEDVIRNRLAHNPDLAAACSAQRASTLILRDPNEYAFHGALLFNLYRQDALRGDGLQARARERQFHAWLKRRSEAQKQSEDRYQSRQEWPLSNTEIAAQVEGDLTLYGADYAIDSLRSWRPRALAPVVLTMLTESLLAAGKQELVKALYMSNRLHNAWKLFILVPCAKAGHAFPKNLLERSLTSWNKRNLDFLRNPNRGTRDDPYRWLIAESLMSGCEIAISAGYPPDTFRRILAALTNPAQRKRSSFSAYDYRALDLTFRALTIEYRSASKQFGVEQYWEVPSDKPDDDKPRSDEQKREQDAYVNALCEVYAQRANLLLPGVAQTGVDSVLSAIRAGAKLSDYTVRRQYEAGRIRAQVASALTILLSVDAIDNKKLLEIAVAIIGDQIRFATEEHLYALGPFRNVLPLHEHLIVYVNEWSAELSGRKIPASERIDTMVRLARFILPISQPTAGAMFIQALNFASDIDEDVLLQIRVQAALATNACPHLSIKRRNELGRDMVCVAGDAILRFDDIREFDWDNFARTLTRLNSSLPLAVAARWEDFGILHRDRILSPAVVEALRLQQFTPEQACALAALIESDNPRVLIAILEAARNESAARKDELAEIVAWDDLFRFGKGFTNNVMNELTQLKPTISSKWVHALQTTVAFVSSRGAEQPVRDPATNDPSPSPIDQWSEPVGFQTADELYESIKKAEKEAERRDRRYENDYVLDLLFQRVPVAQRTSALSSMCDMFQRDLYYSMDRALVIAIKRWRADPAVEEWSASKLPAFLERNIITLGKWVRYGHSVIYDLLDFTRLTSEQIVSLILAGLSARAGDLSAPLALPLVELIAAHLSGNDAVVLSEWYSDRLVTHIPLNDRDLIIAEDIPTDPSTGIARYLFAIMTDVDTRIRWKAAHGFLRLALLQEQQTIQAFASQYLRTADLLYRQPDAPFYHIAGRLWFLIATDQASFVAPTIVACLRDAVWKLATDPSLPHVLLRAFAQTTLMKLEEAQAIHLSTQEKRTLTKLNRSPLKRVKREGPRPGRNSEKSTTKHDFNPIDTIPYWYTPMVNCFTDVSMAEFLTLADNWISEIWKVQADIGIWKDEKRRNRFSEHDWGLWSNDHGSKPVIERPSLYYEWHAMWCVIGELLPVRTLVRSDNDWSYEDLYKQIEDELLTYPPIWLYSLRMPKPLENQFWFEPSSSEDIEKWIQEPNLTFFLDEIGIPNASTTIAVDGGHETQAPWFRSEVHIRTALVSPDRAVSLLRALASADHYRYFVPSEGHELEINKGPYRLLGWLKDPESRDSGIDDHDTFRADIKPYGDIPGSMITEKLSLRSKWPRDEIIRDDDGTVIFSRERWCDDIPMDSGRRRRYHDTPTSKGERLLIEKRALKSFLDCEGLDLVVHIQHTRANRGYDYASSESNEKRHTYNRHFVLRNNGTYEDAFGNSGTW